MSDPNINNEAALMDLGALLRRIETYDIETLKTMQYILMMQHATMIGYPGVVHDLLIKMIRIIIDLKEGFYYHE